ncbi:phosphotransferase [Sporosarcina sp. 179-K 3D1 HS]|uniref:phosphotransferase enzyme family protein n=1 Tax=Sporosarcina sp. 179-K 3D1 HS TaxID=3232169 RepID=UPI0039A10570
MPDVIINTWDRSVDFFNEVPRKAVDLYDGLSGFKLELLNYSENATYLLQNPETGGKRILRVCRPNYHSKEEIESEIQWMLSIGEHTSIVVPKPIVGENGEYVQSIRLDYRDFEYHCVLFTFLEGDEPDIENEEKLIEVFEEIGKTAAQFHKHVMEKGNGFTNIKRPIWDYENLLGDKAKWGRWHDGLAITPAREALFTRVSKVIRNRLERFGQGRERFGLIHGDLRHANLLVRQGEVQVIDFDDSGFGWFLFDLAASLTFIEHRRYVPKLIESWLKGYRQVRPLSEEEEFEIPTFILMRRLQLIAWVGSRENETTTELGSAFTEQTDALAEAYLREFEGLSIR